MPTQPPSDRTHTKGEPSSPACPEFYRRESCRSLSRFIGSAPGLTSGFSPKMQNEPNLPSHHPTIHDSLLTIHYFHETNPISSCAPTPIIQNDPNLSPSPAPNMRNEPNLSQAIMRNEPNLRTRPQTLSSCDTRG